jgi:putative Mn2+ efflux pump MntP
MNRHDTDAVSLAFGIIFVGVAAWWLLDRVVDLWAPSAGWFAAGLLLLLGAIGLVRAFQSDRRPADRVD